MGDKKGASSRATQDPSKTMHSPRRRLHSFLRSSGSSAQSFVEDPTQSGSEASSGSPRSSSSQESSPRTVPATSSSAEIPGSPRTTMSHPSYEIIPRPPTPPLGSSQPPSSPRPQSSSPRNRDLIEPNPGSSPLAHGQVEPTAPPPEHPIQNLISGDEIHRKHSSGQTDPGPTILEQKSRGDLSRGPSTDSADSVIVAEAEEVSMPTSPRRPVTPDTEAPASPNDLLLSTILGPDFLASISARTSISTLFFATETLPWQTNISLYLQIEKSFQEQFQSSLGSLIPILDELFSQIINPAFQKLSPKPQAAELDELRQSLAVAIKALIVRDNFAVTLDELDKSIQATYATLGLMGDLSAFSQANIENLIKNILLVPLDFARYPESSSNQIPRQIMEMMDSDGSWLNYSKQLYLGLYPLMTKLYCGYCRQLYDLREIEQGKSLSPWFSLGDLLKQTFGTDIDDIPALCKAVIGKIDTRKITVLNFQKDWTTLYFHNLAPKTAEIREALIEFATDYKATLYMQDQVSTRIAEYLTNTLSESAASEARQSGFQPR